MFLNPDSIICMVELWGERQNLVRYHPDEIRIQPILLELSANNGETI